jgi:hypothetical protein
LKQLIRNLSVAANHKHIVKKRIFNRFYKYSCFIV